MPSAYCGECEWRYRADGEETRNCSRAMIDHFVETGHSPVERCDAADRLEKRGDDRPPETDSDRRPDPASDSEPDSNPRLE